MLPSTTNTRWFSRLFAWTFQAVVPFSTLYWLVWVWIIRRPDQYRLPRAVELWLLAEIFFYSLVFLPMSYDIHRPGLSPSSLTRKQRRELVRKCFDTINDPVRYISLWHCGAPVEKIGRENVKEWMCWGFFDKTSWNSNEDNELEEHLTCFEKLLPEGKKFRTGRVPETQSLRLTLDPVNVKHKPLALYCFGIGLTDIYTSFIMWNSGYHHYTHRRWCTSFPLRPQTILSPQRSPAKNTSYWYREHTSQSSLPILYLHGIGILHTYSDFFADLAAECDREGSPLADTGIIALEILPISFRITHAALSPSEMCSEVNSILIAHGWNECVLMANSFGTAISSQLLRDPRISTRVRDVVFIDPIPFLLHLPDTTWNFTRRAPCTASQYQLYYFASTDIGAAHTLARRFPWADSILWKDELKGRRWTIVLSELDIIVPVDAVGKYLTRSAEHDMSDYKKGKDWKTAEWKGNSIDVLWMTGLNHAEIFDTKRDRRMLIDIAMNYSTGKRHEVIERPSEFGNWMREHGLFFKCTPARFMTWLGLDKTLQPQFRTA